jgi:hypothetical protein
MVEILTLITLWCGNYADNGDYKARNLHHVQQCREEILKCYGDSILSGTDKKKLLACIKSQRL